MTSALRFALLASALAAVIACPHPLLAQIAPNPTELRAYTGLHAAAAKGDVAEIERLTRGGADKEARGELASPSEGDPSRGTNGWSCPSLHGRPSDLGG